MQKSIYDKKLKGCWLGKAIGGTLGMTNEGVKAEANLNFYDPIPDNLAPNDDLELQVMWCSALHKMEHPYVDRRLLGEIWLRHNRYPCDEYAIATRNMQWGILPPDSGAFGNFFVQGLGAAIRSELWACLAPDNPVLAAEYAFEDACIDHAGNGIYAEQFCAAFESAAFSENDIHKLITVALEVIPEDSLLSQAIRQTVIWADAAEDFRTVRTKILKHFQSDNFTDVVMNIPFVILALIMGRGDFASSVCLAANCGFDTDCTAATTGAMLGIINPESIPHAWSHPIGDKVILSDFLYGVDAPSTLDDFSCMIADLRERLVPVPKCSYKSSPVTSGKVTWEKGLIPWNDFREDIFTVKQWETFSTYGWCGKVVIPGILNGGVLAMKTRFSLPGGQRVRVVFNCKTWMRCFIDGKLRFNREGGEFMPASHRTAMNQFCDIELAAGSHELYVQLMNNGDAHYEAEFYFGVAGAEDKLWIPDVFSLYKLNSCHSNEYMESSQPSLVCV